MTLGPGLEMQRALFQAIANSIEKTLCEILPRYFETEHQPPLMTERDLSQCWCSLLDSQGAAEVSVLIGATNYTVAMSIVQGIRNLTIGQVLDQSHGLRQRLLGSPGGALLHFFGQPPSGGPQSFGGVESNHAFASSYSTLGVLPDLQSKRPQYSGYVQVDTRFELSPGHDSNFLGELERFVTATNQQQVKPVELPGASGIRNLHIGRHDLTYRLGADLASTMEVVRTGDFVNLTRLFLEQLGATGAKLKETNLRNCSCEIGVPIPLEESLHPPVPAGHMSLGERLLVLQPGASRPDVDDTVKVSGYSRAVLEERMKTVGVPSSLRHTLIYLFQDYWTCQGEPLLFDAVADLYDVFSTLYRLFTEVLPKQQRELRERARNSFEKQRLVMFEAPALVDLAALADGLRNALEHRISMARPENEIRDMAVDYKGGLNQIVAAVEAVAKCSLGLAKWATNRSRTRENSASSNRVEATGEGDESAYERSGCITTVTFDSGTTIDQYVFGGLVSAHEAMIAQIKVNVAGAFQPLEYIPIFHEGGHILWNAKRETDPEWPYSNHGLNHFPLTRDDEKGLCELFCEYIEALFVFGGDGDLFLRYMLASYSMRPDSIGRDTDATVERAATILTRGFFVWDAFQTWCGGPATNSPTPLWDQELIENGTEGISARFRQMYHQYAPLVLPLVRLDSTAPSSTYGHWICHEFFPSFLCEYDWYVGKVWLAADQIYREYAGESGRWRGVLITGAGRSAISCTK